MVYYAVYRTSFVVVCLSNLRYQYGSEGLIWLNLNSGLLGYPDKFEDKAGVPVVYGKFARCAGYCTEVVEQRVVLRRLSKLCTGFRLLLVDLMTAPQRAEREVYVLVAEA